MIQNVKALAKKRIEPGTAGSFGHGPDANTDAIRATAPSGSNRATSATDRQRTPAGRPVLALLAPPRALPPASATVRRPDPHSAQWRTVSLFCGLGGLDLGFALEGFHTNAAYDNSGTAVAAYNGNLAATARIADLWRTNPAHESCDLLLAGAPCQGFSTVGKRDADDPRNYLLARIGDAVTMLRPKVVVVENVPAALSGPHGRHWRNLEDRLRWAGYNVRRVKVDGLTTGLAQHRQRLFMVCWTGGGHRRLELPSRPHARLANALADVEGLGGHVPRALGDGDKLATALRIAPGQKLSNVRIGPRNVATWDIPEVYGPTTEDERRLLVLVTRLRRRSRTRSFGDGDPVTRAALADAFGSDVDLVADRLLAGGYLRDREGRLDLRHTYNGKFRRLDWDLPSPTVDTHFGSPANFLHPTEHRGLTLREAMRLQGLPDWYEVNASRAESFRMVGNAVPPPMATVVAEFAREALLKDRP